MGFACALVPILEGCSAQPHTDGALRAHQTAGGAAGRLLRELAAARPRPSSGPPLHRTLRDTLRPSLCPSCGCTGQQLLHHCLMCSNRRRWRLLTGGPSFVPQRAPLSPPPLQLRKQRDQEVAPEAEAEVAVRAILATKLPTLTYDDNARWVSLAGSLDDHTHYEVFAVTPEAVAARSRKAYHAGDWRRYGRFLF